MLPSFTLVKKDGFWTVRIKGEEPKRFINKAKALEYINNKVFKAIGII